MKHDHECYSDKNINNKIKRGHARIKNGVLLFRCSCCHDFNPATDEFYHKDSGRLKTKCKTCWIGRYTEMKEDKEFYKQNKLYEQFNHACISCV